MFGERNDAVGCSVLGGLPADWLVGRRELRLGWGGVGGGECEGGVCTWGCPLGRTSDRRPTAGCNIPSRSCDDVGSAESAIANDWS